LAKFHIYLQKFGRLKCRVGPATCLAKLFYTYSTISDLVLWNFKFGSVLTFSHDIFVRMFDGPCKQSNALCKKNRSSKWKKLLCVEYPAPFVVCIILSIQILYNIQS